MPAIRLLLPPTCMRPIRRHATAFPRHDWFDGVLEPNFRFYLPLNAWIGSVLRIGSGANYATSNERRRILRWCCQGDTITFCYNKIKNRFTTSYTFDITRFYYPICYYTLVVLLKQTLAQATNLEILIARKHCSGDDILKLLREIAAQAADAAAPGVWFVGRGIGGRSAFGCIVDCIAATPDCPGCATSGHRVERVDGGALEW